MALRERKSGTGIGRMRVVWDRSLLFFASELFLELKTGYT